MIGFFGLDLDYICTHGKGIRAICYCMCSDTQYKRKYLRIGKSKFKGHGVYLDVTNHEFLTF